MAICIALSCLCRIQEQSGEIECHHWYPLEIKKKINGFHEGTLLYLRMLSIMIPVSFDTVAVIKTNWVQHY